MTQNRQIILHIGSPKCGSTYLQQVMLKNRKNLLRAGIHYPHDGRGHPGNGSKIGMLTSETLLSMFENGCHSLVFSHEDLLPQPPRAKPLAQIAEAEGIKVQVVCFIRPFSEFIYGDYSQFMKQNFSERLKDRLPYGGQNFEEFAVARARVIAITSWLKAWDQAFPAEPLLLAPHRKIRTVMETMLDLPEEMNWVVHQNQVNRSLRVCDCEALAMAMLDHTTKDTDLKAMFHAAHHNVELPDTGRTDDRNRWIEALFLERNAQINALFGLDNRADTSRPFRSFARKSGKSD